MKTMTAADAKNSFGKFLDMAQREPVLVTKNDRPVGVMFSIADLEDTIWGEQVLRACDNSSTGSKRISSSRE
jgi:prevent-host-death family protein